MVSSERLGGRTAPPPPPPILSASLPVGPEHGMGVEMTEQPDRTL